MQFVQGHEQDTRMASHELQKAMHMKPQKAVKKDAKIYKKIQQTTKSYQKL